MNSPSPKPNSIYFLAKTKQKLLCDSCKMSQPIFSYCFLE
jgi:hypothetical protein